MVSLCDAVVTRYPAAIPLVDFVATEGGLTGWNAAKLGPQPDAATLAAVTQEQVDAAKAAKNPEKRDLKALAAQAVADNAAYLQLTSPTNAQVAAQVRKLTQQNQRVIPRLTQLD